MNLSGPSNKHPLNPKSLPNNNHSRGFKGIKTSSYKWNTKLSVSTCLDNEEPSSLKILYPVAFHFKEERVLASHPLSCHPRRVFGYPENGKKMRETERKKEWCGKGESGKLPVNSLFIDFTIA